MKRIFWVGVGVGIAVFVVRYGRTLMARYVPQDAAAALDTATKVTRTVQGVRTEFRAGVAERQAELLTALFGEGADLDEIRARGRAVRAARAQQRGVGRGERRGAPGVGSPSGELEDPDDDDGYAFF